MKVTQPQALTLRERNSSDPMRLPQASWKEKLVGALVAGDGRGFASIAAALNSARSGEDEKAHEGRTYLQKVRELLEDAGFGSDSADSVEALLFERVRTAFRTYWCRSFLDPANEHCHKANLESALPPSGEEALREALAREGKTVLLGTTAPYREFVCWEKEDSQTFVVGTLDGEIELSVIVLDEVQERGWAAYLSLGEKGVGGWATAEGVHAVLPSYPGGVDAEDFQVGLLRHEAQHVVDARRHTWMRSARLEFRAKLAELAFRADPIPTLRSFALQADSSDPVSRPHGFASHVLVENLRRLLSHSDSPWTEFSSEVASGLARFRVHVGDLHACSASPKWEPSL
jgi:hypothetical protein